MERFIQRQVTGRYVYHNCRVILLIYLRLSTVLDSDGPSNKSSISLYLVNGSNYISTQEYSTDNGGLSMTSSIYANVSMFR